MTMFLYTTWEGIELYTFPREQFCKIHQNLKDIDTLVTSLAVQWLRLRLPMQGVQVQSLVKELRSHMPLGQKTKT